MTKEKPSFIISFCNFFLTIILGTCTFIFSLSLLLALFYPKFVNLVSSTISDVFISDIKSQNFHEDQTLDELLASLNLGSESEAIYDGIESLFDVAVTTILSSETPSKKDFETLYEDNVDIVEMLVNSYCDIYLLEDETSAYSSTIEGVELLLDKITEDDFSQIITDTEKELGITASKDISSDDYNKLKEEICNNTLTQSKYKYDSIVEEIINSDTPELEDTFSYVQYNPLNQKSAWITCILSLICTVFCVIAIIFTYSQKYRAFRNCAIGVILGAIPMTLLSILGFALIAFLPQFVNIESAATIISESLNKILIITTATSCVMTLIGIIVFVISRRIKKIEVR